MEGFKCLKLHKGKYVFFSFNKKNTSQTVTAQHVFMALKDLFRKIIKQTIKQTIKQKTHDKQPELNYLLTQQGISSCKINS